jgi:hypothetical protein
MDKKKVKEDAPANSVAGGGVSLPAAKKLKDIKSILKRKKKDIDEAVVIGKSYSIPQFDGAKNRKDMTDVKVLDVIKKADGSSFVVYQPKGKRKKKVKMGIFRKLIDWASNK